jgi:hypothetical protein
MNNEPQPDPQTNLNTAITNAKNAGYIIITIGVGSSVDTDQLA